jgi:transcriptional regulator with XRE-family HTH domain
MPDCTSPACHPAPTPPRYLRRVRLIQGLTQQELADLAGISVNTIQRLERGEHVPRLDTAHRIAKAVGLEDAVAAFPELLGRP